ncbi:MAG: CBS domain-containing protein [Desulfocapsaceae bacterium]
METLTVKDIMVPIDEYTTVSQEATLYEAIVALGNAQVNFDHARYKHRAVLVLDDDRQVVGKLSQMDVIRGLEPGYRNKENFPEIKHWALSREMAAAMMQDLQLWQEPLKDICRKSASIQVRDIMYTPEVGEYVDQDASLNEAIHQLVMGRHQSLLVLKGNKVSGILRLVDIFSALLHIVNECEI